MDGVGSELAAQAQPFPLPGLSCKTTRLRWSPALSSRRPGSSIQPRAGRSRRSGRGPDWRAEPVCSWAPWCRGGGSREEGRAREDSTCPSALHLMAGISGIFFS